MAGMVSSMLSTIILLLLVFNPIGNVPAFMTELQACAPERRQRVVFRESLIALGILLVFLLAGPAMTKLVGIDPPALQIAGGTLLNLIALGMVFPRMRPISSSSATEGEPFIVPLAMPMIAGPSAMATLLVISRSGTAPLEAWVIALVVAWGITTGVLLMAPMFARLLGRRGLIACERLMGMVLVVVGIQMMLNGIAAFVTAIHNTGAATG